MNIYKSLAEAVEFYERRGFTYVDLPWHTNKAFMDFTLPKGRQASVLKMADAELLLVGSAEQSFLEAFEYLKPGIYQSITPCFRNEEIYGPLHQRYFMKLELIRIGSADYWPLYESARTFFEQYLDVVPKYFGRKGAEYSFGFEFTDIFSSRSSVELGSYGGRECNGYKYAYGTGLAQPRLNYAISHQFS